MRLAGRSCGVLLALALCCACQVVTGLDKLEIVDGGASQSAISDPDARPAEVSAGGSDGRGGKCSVPPGAACDLIGQCGCKPDARCQARGPMFVPACYVTGTLEPGSVCESASACPRGQTCDARTCRSYCRDDRDCPDGRCVDVRTTDSRSRGIRVCAVRCTSGEINPCGPGARCRVVPPGSDTYCAAPDDPCMTVEDGICDEARGTGQCAEGTDARDCTCHPELPGASCDPVEQCGCAKGSACAVTQGEAGAQSAECRPWTGDKAQDGRCELDGECAPGHVCELGGSCARLCRSDDECGESGTCAALEVGSRARAGLKTCHTRCDREQSGCAEGLRCAHVDGRFTVEGDYCVAPVAQCRTNDGVCDDARGSGLCADGTDVVDCCRPSIPGGECDLVAQCGCEAKPRTSCAVVVRENGGRTSACVVPGDVPVDHVCVDDASCGRGAGCYGHVCRLYCEDDADCEKGGRCVFAGRTGMSPMLKMCLGPCDPGTNEPCGENTRCTPGTVDDVPANGCTFVPLTATCPRRDGRCDEPEGTGLCAEGEDAADC